MVAPGVQGPTGRDGRIPTLTGGWAPTQNNPLDCMDKSQDDDDDDD